MAREQCLIMPSRVSKHRLRSVKAAVTLFQNVDNTQRLEVVFEPSEIPHAFVQRILPTVSKGRVPKVMRESNAFDQILIQCQIARNRARDLGYFDTVGEAGAKQVAFMINKDLGLVLEPAKRGRMDNAIPVALKFTSPFRRRLGNPAPT